MTRAQHAVWAALRDAGPSTVDALAARTGAARQTAHEHLLALWRAGHVDRTGGGVVGTGKGRAAHVYVATTEPVVAPPMLAIDAVRQVLAAGPVTGRAEIARRAGFCDHSVSAALSSIAICKRVGQRGPPTYRLREGA